MVVLGMVMVVLMVAIDQATKFAAVKYVGETGSITVIEGILGFTLVENRGAAYGMFQGGRWVFVVLTLAIITMIVFYYVNITKSKIKNKTTLWTLLSLIFITAGAVGNLIDRVRFGYVVDFIRVRFIEFPVFNMADIYVVVGTATLAIIMLFLTKEDTLKNNI